jgi:hypothetical protein
MPGECLGKMPALIAVYPSFAMKEVFFWGGGDLHIET